jgi:hypothetical protein
MGTLGSGPTIASVWFANKSTTTVGDNGNLIDSPNKAKGANNSTQPTKHKPKVRFNVSKLLLCIYIYIAAILAGGYGGLIINL